jgi:7-cyano-7-deazaguanine synthase
MSTAIVLLSGGMDSLVCLGEALHLGADVGLLHMNYGQKTSERELASFHAIADHYRIPQERRKVINMQFLQQLGGSSLTDAAIAVKDYQGDSDAIPDSYVPFRNTIILSLAVSWAEVVKAGQVFIGANHEDSPGYPDCRPSYYAAFNEVIRQGTKASGIEVLTPVIGMKKKEIVRRGAELKVPFELSWSCYRSSERACGQCDSCALRLRGFREANLADPISYEA